MSLAQVTEFQVHLYRFKANHATKWRAQVVAFPQFTAEGTSRDAVLEEIKEQLATLEAESEVVRVPLGQRDTVPLEPAPPLDEELAAKLRAKGYEYFGAFADDPGALELFDEIERERDLHIIGG
jgi:hypothetical protein